MMKRLLLSLAATLALALCAGCLFPKNFDKTKKDPHTAADMEKEFQQRWMDKRVGDLTSQGMAPDAARAKAAAEFREKYSYTRAAGQ